MIEVGPALSLVLANAVVVVAFLALSTVRRRNRPTPSAPCSICAVAAATTTVQDEAVCQHCRDEYLHGVR